MPCQIQNGPLRYILGTLEITPAVPKRNWSDCLLPQDWFKAARLSRKCSNRHDKWKYYVTRHEGENAAALAFAKLAAERRAELLAPLPPPTRRRGKKAPSPPRKKRP